MKLEEFKMFNKINKDDFMKKTKLLSYNKDDMIFNEGEDCVHLSFILDGEISIRTYSLNDKEEILGVFYPGDIFGDVICFSNNHKYIGHVIANKSSIIAHIHKEDWLYLIQKNTQLLNNFVENITNKTYESKMQNKILAHKKIEDRIYYYLNSLIDNNNFVFISSVTDLARKLNLPRPSVSRSLTNMENKGLIKRHEKKIEVL